MYNLLYLFILCYNQMQSDSCFEQNSQMQHARVCCNGNKHVHQNGIQFNTLRKLSMPCTWMATFEKIVVYVHQRVCDAAIGENLTCRWEPTKESNIYAVAARVQ